jgi:O-antigen ligase
MMTQAPARGWHTARVSAAIRSTVAVWFLCCSTLAFVPGGMTRFVFPKLLLVALSIAIGMWAQRRGRLPLAALAVVGLGALVLVLAAFAGPAPWAALVGRWPRYEGALTLGLYLGAAGLGARLLYRDAAAQRQLTRALCVVALALVATAGAEALGWYPLGRSDAERPGGLLGNATDLGIVALLAFAMLLRPAVNRRDPWAMAGVGAALVTIAISGSRAAAGASLLVVAVHVLWAESRRLRNTVGACGLLAVAVFALTPTLRDRLWAGHTVNGRAQLWADTVDLIREHPWLGVGPSGYFEAIAKFHGASWVREVGVANPPDSPHLWLLQAAAAGGLPLLLLALALAAVVARRAWHAVREGNDFAVGAAAAGLAYSVVLLTHFTTAGTTPLAAFIVGGLIARPATSQAAWWQRAVAACAAVAALWAVTGACAEIALQDGVEAAARGDVTGADHAFDIARQWRPWDADVALLAAMALAEPASSGDPGAIEATLGWADRNLATVPNSRGAKIARAVGLTRSGRFSASIGLLGEVITAAPTEPQAYIERAIAHLGAGDIPAARGDITRAEHLDPHSPIVERIDAFIANAERQARDAPDDGHR